MKFGSGKSPLLKNALFSEEAGSGPSHGGTVPTKSEVRRLVRARRSEIAARYERQKDRLIPILCDQLFSLPALVMARTIFVYLELPGEVPVRPLLNDLIFRRNQAGDRATTPVRRIAVPWCDGNKLRFLFLSSEFKPDQLFSAGGCPELAPGAFGILEPVSGLKSDRHVRAEPDRAEVVLVPGMAFTSDGIRLGRGKGYYDRFLAQTRPETARIALAFHEQLFDTLPTDDWDEKVDQVLIV